MFEYLTCDEETMQVICNSCNELIEFAPIAYFSYNEADLIITCPNCGRKFTVSKCDKCGGYKVQYPNGELAEKCIECHGTGYQCDEITSE
jgi:hypothetical protein